MDTALLERADFAARLCEAVADWTIAGQPEWTVEDEYDILGVQAYILRLAGGERWLVIPGTGYAAQGRPSEKWSDWSRNLRSAFAWPRLGAEGRFWWPWGFAEAALLLDEWLGGRAIEYAVGHSQGGGILQPLAYWRWNLLGEAHALAAPKGAFSRGLPHRPGLHCWLAPDDWVTRHPLLGCHAGTRHVLPPMGRGHDPVSYRARLFLLRQGLAA